MYPLSLSSSQSSMNYSSFLNLPILHLELSTGNFCDIVNPYRFFKSPYMRYEDSVFWSCLNCLLLAFAYQCMAWHIPPLIPSGTINIISTSVSSSNFTSDFFRNVCHANPGADKSYAASSSYISMNLLQKFWNTSASNNVSLCMYRSWYPLLYSEILPDTFGVFLISFTDFCLCQITMKLFVWKWRFIEFLPTIHVLI